MFLIFMKLQFGLTNTLANPSLSEEEYYLFKSIFAIGNLNTDQAEQNHKTFRLNTTEIDKFYNSLSRIREMNNYFIKHIHNFDLENKNNVIGIHSSSLDNFLHEISKKRKNSENNYSCEYEFMKLCELFCQTLHYISKNKKDLMVPFFQFIRKSILPILSE